MRLSDWCEVHTLIRQSDWCEHHTTLDANIEFFFFFDKKIAHHDFLLSSSLYVIINSTVETNPPLSPSPRGYPCKFNLREDHANKKGVSSN